jgi:hypothetical protein
MMMENMSVKCNGLAYIYRQVIVGYGPVVGPKSGLYLKGCSWGLEGGLGALRGNLFQQHPLGSICRETCFEGHVLENMSCSKGVWVCHTRFIHSPLCFITFALRFTDIMPIEGRLKWQGG